MYKIEFYEDKNGRSEIADYLKALNVKAVTSKESRINFNKIVAYMDMLEELGTLFFIILSKRHKKSQNVK